MYLSSISYQPGFTERGCSPIRREVRRPYVPWELEQELGRFMEYYTHERYHESLKNLKLVDIYEGRGQQILNRRDLNLGNA